jgi:DNA polymerase I
LNRSIRWFYGLISFAILTQIATIHGINDRRNLMRFDPKNTIFLIDASNFLYRSYYGLPPMSTKKGESVQAVFSFCRTIKKIIDQYDPKYMALIWDAKGKTDRHEIYPEYKATRQKAPSDLFSQKERVLEFADLIGLVHIEQSGTEADDLIASLTKKFEIEGNQIIILSSDKDLGQLLSGSVMMLDTFKDTLTDKIAFEKKIGFPVSHLPVFYGLVGDASDNIPGVAGVGKKSAEQLAKQYGSMQEIYEHIDEITPSRVQNALKNDKENAFLSETLFTLHFPELQITKKDIYFEKEQWGNAESLFQELNFISLLKTTNKKEDAILEEKRAFWKKKGFHCITDQEAFKQLCNRLQKASFFAYDTETTGLNPLHTELVGISFCLTEKEVFYVPCGHTAQETQLLRDEVIQAVKPIFENETIGKIGHNMKYDALVLSQYGVLVRGLFFDTYIAAQLAFEESVRTGLKLLASHVFQEEMLTYEELVKNKKLRNFAAVSLEDATLYSGADSYEAFRLKVVLEKKLQETKQQSLYQEIEQPLIQVLIAMEKQGIFCDTTVLLDLDKEVSKEVEKLEKEISSYSENKSINLNSPQQVRTLLFDILQLPPQKKSATGAHSTDIEVLEALSALHPIVELLIQYRELAKLKSTYIESLPTFINPRDKKIHTTFAQLKTATGRLASNAPNLQNIPADPKKIGGKIREAFLPDNGNVFLSADYSQIELRILAYLSQDQNLVAAFLKNHDIHAETAARLFEVSLDQVSHEQRQIGKRINFSILYGLTPYGLSKDLKIPFQDAKIYIKKYFEQYPGVSIWVEQVIAFTHEHGFVESFWGRRRAIPNIYQKNKTLYEEARRIAINTVAQGTAADLVKKGMIAVHHWAEKENPDTKIVLQIHDELLISVPNDQTNAVETIVSDILESAVSWNVPLKVTTRIGKNWKEVTK